MLLQRLDAPQRDRVGAEPHCRDHHAIERVRALRLVGLERVDAGEQLLELDRSQLGVPLSHERTEAGPLRAREQLRLLEPDGRAQELERRLAAPGVAFEHRLGEEQLHAGLVVHRVEHLPRQRLVVLDLDQLRERHVMGLCREQRRQQRPRRVERRREAEHGRVRRREVHEALVEEASPGARRERRQLGHGRRTPCVRRALAQTALLDRDADRDRHVHIVELVERAPRLGHVAAGDRGERLRRVRRDADSSASSTVNASHTSDASRSPCHASISTLSACSIGSSSRWLATSFRRGCTRAIAAGSKG